MLLSDLSHSITKDICESTFGWLTRQRPTTRMNVSAKTPLVRLPLTCPIRPPGWGGLDNHFNGSMLRRFSIRMQHRCPMPRMQKKTKETLYSYCLFFHSSGFCMHAISATDQWRIGLYAHVKELIINTRVTHWPWSHLKHLEATWSDWGNWWRWLGIQAKGPRFVDFCCFWSCSQTLTMQQVGDKLVGCRRLETKKQVSCWPHTRVWWWWFFLQSAACAPRSYLDLRAVARTRRFFIYVFFMCHVPQAFPMNKYVIHVISCASNRCLSSLFCSGPSFECCGRRCAWTWGLPNGTRSRREKQEVCFPSKPVGFEICLTCTFNEHICLLRTVVARISAHSTISCSPKVKNVHL